MEALIAIALGSAVGYILSLRNEIVGLKQQIKQSEQRFEKFVDSVNDDIERFQEKRYDFIERFADLQDFEAISPEDGDFYTQAFNQAEERLNERGFDKIYIKSFY